MRGNHDDWAWRKLPPGMKKFWKDPLELVSEGVPNASIVKTKFKTKKGGKSITESPYAYIYNDVWFSHANHLSCEKLSTWYDNWRDTLAISRPMAALVQHHTHAFRHIVINGGTRHLVEPGMGADPCAEAYKISYQNKWRPGVPAYLYLEFENGKLKLLEPKLL
jgi:hypothetical protein